jgi:hypothetical protein
VSGADRFLVCAQAFLNRLEKMRRKTRGFTSCLVFPNAGKNVKVTNLFLCFRMKKH